MDSQVRPSGRLMDVVDDAWRREELPLEEVSVPVAELPDADGGDQSGQSLREQENKWHDLALNQYTEPSGNLIHHSG